MKILLLGLIFLPFTLVVGAALWVYIIGNISLEIIREGI